MKKFFIIISLACVLMLMAGLCEGRCRAYYNEGYENGRSEEGVKIFRAIEPFIDNVPNANYIIIDKIAHSDYTLLVIDTGAGKKIVWANKGDR